MNEPRQLTTFTREELYQRIWSSPTQALAKELGITGTGLAKICKRMDVPVPPRGHWNKLHAGKATVQFRLPPATADTQLQVTIRPTPPPFVPPPPPPVPDIVRAKIDTETAKVGSVHVPQTLAKPHPLIKKWIAEDRKREAENRRARWSMPHDPIDGTEVKKRRLRIMSALFFEWERLGHRVKTEGYSNHWPYLEIGNRKIEFTLFEYERQRRRPLTDEEKYDSLYQHSKWRQVKEPTGELIFRVKTHLGQGAPTQWRDQENLPLEDQLGELLVRLIAAPALLDEEDERRREAERRRWQEEQKIAEQKRLRRVDAARWQHVTELAAASDEVKQAREFLDALERKAGADNRDGTPPEEVRKWLDWARAKANQMDPLTHPLADLLAENQAVNEWTYR